VHEKCYNNSFWYGMSPGRSRAKTYDIKHDLPLASLHYYHGALHAHSKDFLFILHACSNTKVHK
jgi:hypothetical protein